jgi:hypothetical protein
MPITLQQIASNTAQLSFQWGSDAVNVTYYPGKITEKVLSDLSALDNLTGSNFEQAFAAFNEMLTGLLQSWDVLENDGVTMFPIDASRFSELPLLFRKQVLMEITKAMSPEATAPTMESSTQNSFS